MKIRVRLVRLAAFLAVGCAPRSAADYPRDAELRLNHIQVLGSHNSYRQQPPDAIFAQLRRISSDWADTLEYSHPPLTRQFNEQGVRQIELDVFADPAGGLFARPRGLELLTTEDRPDLSALSRPGFKVLHIQDVDFVSSCLTLLGCLREVQSWSDAHRDHAPLLILIQANDDPQEALGGTRPVPFDAARFEALDAEIRAVFPGDRLITPDEVRGDRSTLQEAIHARGWPTLSASRGRILFALENEGAHKAAYLEGHSSLRGRVMFTTSRPGEAEAAFATLNDPITDFDEIKALVARGFLVRTRADAGTVQARAGDVTMRDAALASGAQFVSTDYLVANPAFKTGYRVTLPGDVPWRCNPLTAPPGCQPSDVERIAR
jgi:hypothetical protein